MGELVSSLRLAYNLSTYGPCKHCQRRAANRCRGLCSPCYYTSSIRELYPTARKFCKRIIEEKPEPTPIPTCDPDSLPCLVCSAIVKVKPHMRARAVRLRCPWTLCPVCVEKAKEKA